ncbi:MAG: ABC-three component system protein [Saprospiraceae bacterium]
MSLTNFSAKEPSLGYFYQIKYSLLLLLQNSRELNAPEVRLETLDDVEIEDFDRLDLYQTKLHVNSKANLTDSSVDFWKTIRVWAEHIVNGVIDIDNTSFNLVTTDRVPESSVLFNFVQNRNIGDVEKVVAKLDLITIQSTSTANEKAYKAYQKLDIGQKKKLINKILIIDSSLGIIDIDEKTKKELIFSTYPGLLDAFLEVLSGWWFKKSIENLTGQIDSIKAEELQLKIASISESFKSDNLPNHFPEQLEVSDSEVDSMKEKIFLKQLNLIEIDATSRAVKRAISDFRRAFEQRSKWLRLHLLNPDEEEEYDSRLQDYWKNIFDIMCDETDQKTEEELKVFGRKFYLDQFAKICPQVKIRERFNEDYFTRGSYQILSDAKKVGWHPKFKDQI